jgi:hypothetical protein
MSYARQNVMSEVTVRQWCRMFTYERQMFTMKSEVVGQPTVVSDDLLQSVDQNIRERQSFPISKLSCEFPQISRTLLYDITVKVCHHKL